MRRGDRQTGSRTGRVTPLLCLVVALSAVLPAPAAAQDAYFGQNKVQYRDYDWTLFRTEHFEIYYHQGGEEIAEFAAVACEHAYQRLRILFRFELSERVPIILYGSHNDFQQTNVTPGILQEGIGGFTEFLKQRVVVPFEGSYDQFRHVLHHELSHAVVSAMIWGTGIGSLVSRAQSPGIPLWFEEGLAEYASMGWDLDADAFMRDAVITGYLPPLQQIYGGILAYKGGQSFWNFFDSTYGAGRIAEVLGNLRLLRNVDHALMAAVGKPVEDLSEDWHRWLKRQYWPEIADRQMADEFASPLTDHQEDGSVYNVFPALSPEGDKIAFISDRRQYLDLYVISAIDGTTLSHLGQGEKAGKFEEMHILRGGVSWSPDGKRIAVAAKGGKYDTIYLVDAADGRVTAEIKPELDGVFEPEWRPDGSGIVFVGIKDGISDLYLYLFADGTFERLTHDEASESGPAWSFDGRRLAFASDAPVNGAREGSSDLPVRWGPKNILVMDLGAPGRPVTPVVSGPFDDTDPAWGEDDSELAYVSNRSGVRNLYLRDLESGEERPLTNILTGVDSFEWTPQNRALTFSAFNGAGFDIFLFKNPTLRRGTITLTRTELVQEMERERLREAARPAGFADTDTIRVGDLSRLRFRPLTMGFRGPDEPDAADRVPLSRHLGGGVDASEPAPYRVRMTPDILIANAGYYGYFGLAGSTYLEMSDILGNHNLSVTTSLWSTLDNSNYQFTYTYLKHRMNVGGSLFYYNYFYVPEYRGRSIYGDRNYGGTLLGSYPFTRFLRVDLSASYLGILRRIYATGPAQRSSRRSTMLAARVVGDNTIPGYTGYINGHRYSLELTHSPNVPANSLAFTSLEADFRSYSRVGPDHSFAFRLAAGSSIGAQPQQFFLGGNGFWWGPQYARADLYDLDNLYFASFQAPLRGFDFYEFSGNRFALANLEFRFPLVRLIALGWPVPLVLPNIRGALFWDMGMAWDDWKVHPFSGRGGIGFDDLKSGMGLGARMNIGFLILKLDVAWRYQLRRFDGKPRWYIALGPEF